MRIDRAAASLGRGLAVAVMLVWSLAPIVLIALSSFKPERDIFATPPTFLFAPTWDNYALLWTKWRPFFAGLGNSLIVTAGATALALAVSAMAGYAYSRRTTAGMRASALSLVAIRLIPPIVLTLPLFPIANALGLSDTHVLLMILYATFFVSLGALLMRGFIDQIPRELDEAALVDGGDHWLVFLRVVLPLCAQGLLAVAVFVIVFSWNEFLFAFIFTSNRAKTAPMVISEMIGSFDGVDWGVLFAASTVQLAPVVIFVVAMQKHLVAGLTSGAVKG